MGVETLLHKPTPSQPFEWICMTAILDRLRMTQQQSVTEAELQRRLVGRFFEMKMAKEIPGILSVAQLRTITGMDQITESKVNKVHSVPDVFSYRHTGWRKTHPVFEIDGIGEIKGLTEEEGVEFLDALYKEKMTRKNKIQKAVQDGGFPLTHRNKYNLHIERIPLRFSPDNAERWTRQFFSQFRDSQVSLSDNLSYVILLPSDTYQAMGKRVRDYRFEGIYGMDELFLKIGVNRVESMPWSREEADIFARDHLSPLREMVHAINVNVK
jgi:hypothetical protein